MRKKRKRKLKKRVFNLTHMFMVVCSVSASYGAIALSDSLRDLKFRDPESSTPALSAHRITVAFEPYNRRFTP